MMNDTTRNIPRIAWEAPEPPIQRVVPLLRRRGLVAAAVATILATGASSFLLLGGSVPDVAPVVAAVETPSTKEAIRADPKPKIEKTEKIASLAVASPVRVPAPAVHRKTPVEKPPLTAVQAIDRFASVSPIGTAVRAADGAARIPSLAAYAPSETVPTLRDTSRPPVLDDVVEAAEEDASVAVPEARPPASDKDMRRMARSANLRSKPGGRTVGTIRKGTRVEVVRCDDWCEIKADGRRGFVYKRFVGRG